jgi:hypothetical protein
MSADTDFLKANLYHCSAGLPAFSFLNYWEKKYKHMWEIDKEAYIRRYVMWAVTPADTHAFITSCTWWYRAF